MTRFGKVRVEALPDDHHERMVRSIDREIGKALLRIKLPPGAGQLGLWPAIVQLVVHKMAKLDRERTAAWLTALATQTADPTEENFHAAGDANRQWVVAAASAMHGKGTLQ